MPKLRVVIMESEIPDVLVGQALEKDLCVQGDSVEEIERLMHNQVQFHTGKMKFVPNRGDEPYMSEDNLDQISAAPQRFFDMWDASQGFALRSVTY